MLDELYKAFWRTTNLVCRMEVSGRCDGGGPTVKLHCHEPGGVHHFDCSTTMEHIESFMAGPEQLGVEMGMAALQGIKNARDKDTNG